MNSRQSEKLSLIISLLEAGGEVTIAGLGDSLTYGWMVERGFFDVFCDELERHYDRAVITRLHAGVPGDTASGGFARLHSVLTQSPDLVLVQFGINDMCSGEPPSAFEYTVESIAKWIVDKNCTPLLLTSPALADRASADRLAPYQEAIRVVADKLGVDLADIEAHWQRETHNLERGSGWFLSDDTHPSEKGHYLMAEALLAVFFQTRDTMMTPPPPFFGPAVIIVKVLHCQSCGRG